MSQRVSGILPCDVVLKVGDEFTVVTTPRVLEYVQVQVQIEGIIRFHEVRELSVRHE